MFETNQPTRLVLYADDDYEDLNFVRESFLEHAADIRLVTFSDATSLLDYIQKRKNSPAPCLIILDINMPRVDGKTALRILRTINGYEHIPVVLFTTSISPHDAKFAEAFNAGFISKPLTAWQMDTITNVFLNHCNESLKK